MPKVKNTPSSGICRAGDFYGTLMFAGLHISVDLAKFEPCLSPPAAREWLPKDFLTYMIDEILSYNREFVAREGYREYATSKYPDKKIAIVTCMDTRLVELLPAALGIRNGDVKMIKNAGGTITHPFDSTMRSLLVAVYELGVEEIMVIGHTGCGVQGMNAAEMLELMRHRGIDEEHISLMRHCGIDLDSWLHGFDDGAESVRETVDLIRNHPLMTKDIRVAGYMMDSSTGALTLI